MASILEMIHSTQIDTLAAQPFIQLQLTSAVSWPTGYANTPLTWPTPVTDTYGMWASGIPTRVTPHIAGYYLVVAQCDFAQNSTSGRDVDLKKNGNLGASGAFAAQFCPAITDSYYHTVLNCVGVVYCNGNSDYFEMYPYQTSGGNLNINATATKMTAIRIHN